MSTFGMGGYLRAVMLRILVSIKIIPQFESSEKNFLMTTENKCDALTKLKDLTKFGKHDFKSAEHISNTFLPLCSVVDPDPEWIRIQ
jgi:hypothetical protein